MARGRSYNSLEFMDIDDDRSTSKPVDFAFLLWKQLDRILKTGSYNATPLYVSSVLELHQILKPFHDKKYIEFIKSLKDNFEIQIAETHPRDRDSLRPILEKKMAFEMFGALVQLMTNKSLLPAKAL